IVRTKLKRLQQRPPSAKAAKILMKDDSELGGHLATPLLTQITESTAFTGAAIAKTTATGEAGTLSSPQKLLSIENATITASQDSATSNSRDKVSRALAEAAVATITLLAPPPLLPLSFVSASAQELGANDSNSRTTKILNDENDQDKEDLLIITDTVIDQTMSFNPPSKEWIMQKSIELQLLRTRSNKAAPTIPSFGIVRRMNIIPNQV
ncbi:unnamed protein product, partial [Didymodactylos carnosus]